MLRCGPLDHGGSQEWRQRHLSSFLGHPPRQRRETAVCGWQPIAACAPQPSSSRPMSIALAEWVRAPQLMKSTPVSAMAWTLSRVTPPEASSKARPRRGHGPASASPRKNCRGELCRLRLQWPHRVLQGLNFHLDLQGVGDPLSGLSALLRDPSGRRDMIVFDEHPVIEPETMVGSPSMPHRFFLERTPEGRGLPRIQESAWGAGHGIHHLSRQRGDAGQALQQIERGALTLQAEWSLALQPENMSVGRDFLSILKETDRTRAGSIKTKYLAERFRTRRARTASRPRTRACPVISPGSAALGSHRHDRYPPGGPARARRLFGPWSIIPWRRRSLAGP